MSLTSLNKEELHKLAAKADVELNGDETKNQIIAKLKENNVGYEFYKKAFLGNDDEEENETSTLFDNSDVLIKMERRNPTFQAYGVTFTREHPYAIVDPLTAQNIIDNYEGFRLASPAEAKAFYS
jgi:hypothetical protein